MKRCCRQDQNGRVDKQGEHKRAGGINGCEFDRLPFPRRGLFKLPRLHYRRMEIKIMRHHRGTQNADADVQHPLIGHDSRTWNEPEKNSGEAGFRENQLRGKTPADRDNQGKDERFDVTKAFVLQEEHNEHVHGGNDATPYQRNPK